MRWSTNANQPVYMDPARPFVQRVKGLIARLTLDEKVGLMSHPAKGVPRLASPITCGLFTNCSRFGCLPPFAASHAAGTPLECHQSACRSVVHLITVECGATESFRALDIAARALRQLPSHTGHLPGTYDILRSRE